MRILHIASGDFFSTYGGGQIYVKNIVDEMIRQNMDVVVVSQTGNHIGVIQKNYNGIPLFEINSQNDLKKVLKEAKPKVIHAHSMKDLACRLGREAGVPVVVTSHHGGIICPVGTRLNFKNEICHATVCHKNCLPCLLHNIYSGRYWYPFMRLLPERVYTKLGEIIQKFPFMPFVTPIGSVAVWIKRKQAQWRTIVSDCTLMIAPCHEIATAMVENGLRKEKIRVIPHGIPLPPKTPEIPDFADGKVKFFYVGRICYAKGIHILLEAFSSIKNLKIELHLIGDAANKHERSYINKLKKRYDSDKRIFWYGKINPDTIFKKTQNFHIAISPTICLEVFGLNIAEALALGKPVLATKSGGSEMQIHDGKNGWLVPPNNPIALAEKISFIASHPQMISVMSKNCHAIAISNHCKAINCIYEEIINIQTNNNI